MAPMSRNINIVQGQAIGKSRAGNTTKIHLAVDVYGLPIEFDGQAVTFTIVRPRRN